MTSTLLQRLQDDAQARGESSFAHVCSQFQLAPEPLWNAVTTNPSQQLPYHGLTHNLNVAYDSVFLATEERLDADSCKALWLAGLFHDYAHSGGKQSDTHNVIQAAHHYKQHTQGTDMWMERVIQLILTTNTEITRNPSSMTEQVIRDADLLGWAYLPFEATADALSAELSVPVTESSTRSFLQSHHFNTQTARHIMSEAGWVTAPN